MATTAIDSASPLPRPSGAATPADTLPAAPVRPLDPAFGPLVPSASLPVNPLALPPPAPIRAVTFLPAATLTASVGRNGANRAADVRLVQERLHALGFPLTIDGVMGGRTRRALERFISIGFGEDYVRDTLHPHDHASLRLFDPAAPRWVKLGDGGPGWMRHDREGYDWAAGQAVETIERAGARYARYQAQNPGAPNIAVNDISRVDGRVFAANGRPEHETHRNGLDVDIRLPKRGPAAERHGTSIHNADYDRESTYAMLDAFASDERVERILFADRVLIQRAIADGKSWAAKLLHDPPHHHHIHIDIKPAYR